MNYVANIYRAAIVRAVLGPNASELKVHDIARLNQFAEHLADCESARSAMHAKGYGRGASSFVEVVREVPDNSPAMLKSMFAPRTLVGYPRLGPAGATWSGR
jgi:hypothetical protein